MYYPETLFPRAHFFRGQKSHFLGLNLMDEPSGCATLPTVVYTLGSLGNTGTWVPDPWELPESSEAENRYRILLAFFFFKLILFGNNLKVTEKLQEE